VWLGRRVRYEARGRVLPLAGENRDEENREDAAAGLEETGGRVGVVRGAHRFRCPRVPGPGSICQALSALSSFHLTSRGTAGAVTVDRKATCGRRSGAPILRQRGGRNVRCHWTREDQARAFRGIRARGYEPRIPTRNRRGQGTTHDALARERSVIERTFAWLSYMRRLATRWERRDDLYRVRCHSRTQRRRSRVLAARRARLS
jgi:hypothetical protein